MWASAQTMTKVLMHVMQKGGSLRRGCVLRNFMGLGVLYVEERHWLQRPSGRISIEDQVKDASSGDSPVALDRRINLSCTPPLTLPVCRAQSRHCNFTSSSHVEQHAGVGQEGNELQGTPLRLSDNQYPSIRDFNRRLRR
eukprot:5140757-Amphidinium_carterae.1